MTCQRTVAWFTSFLVVAFVWAGNGWAADISGTIATTLIISEDSKFVGDVTCTVNGVPCIAIGASGITLDLNGFSMTGLGNSETACGGGPSTFPPVVEDGIDVNGQTGVTIRGPGLIQRFRGPGIYSYNSSSRLTVTGVTVSSNCFSGILVGGGSEHELTANVAVRNGNGTFPCGGI